jgi:hypothetical protein
MLQRLLAAVDYPKALSSASACYEWLQGTAGAWANPLALIV